MKFDNFQAVDEGFSNFIGGVINTTGTTPQYVWKNIQHCMDVYTLFEPSVGVDSMQPINVVNVGIRNRYLWILAQAYSLNNAIAVTTPIVPMFTPNDIRSLISNFKLRLRPLAIAYANNPTALNLQNLNNQINSLNVPLASKGLRFNMQVGSM